VIRQCLRTPLNCKNQVEQLITPLSIEALILTDLPKAARFNVERLDPYFGYYRFLLSPASKIILPTNAVGGYGDYI
jgi:hypothetical protein